MIKKAKTFYWYHVTEGYERSMDGEEGELVFEVNDEYTTR